MMSYTKYALYFQYIDKNIFPNCKPSFDIEEIWKTFYDNWHKILYISTKLIFKRKCREFQAKYENNY